MRIPKGMVAFATWGLVVVFGFLAIAHVVLTVLFYTGVRDQGVGYFLDLEVAAWLITLLDAFVVFLVLVGRRVGSSDAWGAVGAMLVATVIVVGRTIWMVLPPVFAAILLLDALGRVQRTRTS